MLIKVIILFSLILTSCVTTKSSIISSDREAKHSVFPPGIHPITTIKEIVPLLQTLNEHDLVA